MAEVGIWTRQRAHSAQKRLLQLTVGLLCLVPLSAGFAGMMAGPDLVGASSPVDLDSHFRYLSGLLFAIGLGFCTTIPGIERKGAPFRALGCLVIIGGLGRLVSLLAMGVPSAPHCLALLLELGIVPALMLWQNRLSRVG